MNEDTKLQSVELSFHYEKPDGSCIQVNAEIDSDGNWFQSGATKDEMSRNVALIEEIRDVVGPFLVGLEEDDE